jgi:predicted transporter
MKIELARKQMSSVPCPTCGVAVGMRCILYSAALRLEPHVLRKLAAIEALERKLAYLEHL